MTINKTKPTKASVASFIATVASVARRDDARALLTLMRRVCGIAPRMWGPSIVGFGTVHYRYDTRHEGDMPRMGFSPRKARLVLYLSAGPRTAALLTRLGKHKSSVACLYIHRLADVDVKVLELLIEYAWGRAALLPAEVTPHRRV